MWRDVAREWATDHRVICYDWRGYGGSGAAGGASSHPEDLLALLDALRVSQASLVGCSMGGSYALEVALAAPERVRALALVCSGLSGRPRPESMREQAHERVDGVVPEERWARYRAGETTPFAARDAQAVAEAQAAWMVAGPDRGPQA